jgi:hypothetical protein
MSCDASMMSASVDWGDVPTWVGSIGTVLTLGVGLLLLMRELADRRREHAARVMCWIDHEAGKVLVRNGSDQPVTRVMVALFAVPGHYVEPRTGHRDDPYVGDWAWLGPGEEREMAPEGVEWYANLFPSQVRMEFTDTSVRRWLRDEYGTLSRKYVMPFRQDWSKFPAWSWAQEQNRRARRMYTRWHWPDI